MKAFSFRLGQALRWRETRVALQKAAVATASARVAGLRQLLTDEAARKEQGARELAAKPDGQTLTVWPDYSARVDQRLENLRNEANEAQKAADAAIVRLVEANRGVRLLENLKQKAQGRWQREADRELGVFADEASLVRLQSIKKTGA